VNSDIIYIVVLAKIQQSWNHIWCVNAHLGKYNSQLTGF
jgi:hypothetical protein